MSLSGIGATVAILVSLSSALVSLLAYIQNSSRSRLRDQQSERMRIVAVRTIILWEQVQTILSSAEYGYPVDDYLFPSIQNNARRLEKALDLAISSGLTQQIISQREQALVLYTAFVQALFYITTDLGTDQIRKACLDDHFTLGMIRLQNQCLDFKHDILPSYLTDSDFVRNVSDRAWNYLSGETNNRDRAMRHDGHESSDQFMR